MGIGRSGIKVGSRSGLFWGREVANSIFKPLLDQNSLNSYVGIYRATVCSQKSVPFFVLIDVAQNSHVDHRYAPPTKFQRKPRWWHGQRTQ